MTIDQWREVHQTIAKDLHGEVGGNLFAVRLGLQSLINETDQVKLASQVDKLTNILVATEQKLVKITGLLSSKN